MPLSKAKNYFRAVLDARVCTICVQPILCIDEVDFIKQVRMLKGGRTQNWPQVCIPLTCPLPFSVIPVATLFLLLSLLLELHV